MEWRSRVAYWSWALFAVLFLLFVELGTALDGRLSHGIG